MRISASVLPTGSLVVEHCADQDRHVSCSCHARTPNCEPLIFVLMIGTCTQGGTFDVQQPRFEQSRPFGRPSGASVLRDSGVA